MKMYKKESAEMEASSGVYTALAGDAVTIQDSAMRTPSEGNFLLDLFEFIPIEHFCMLSL